MAEYLDVVPAATPCPRCLLDRRPGARTCDFCSYREEPRAGARPTATGPRHYLGLDLGQVSDFTALAVLRETPRKGDKPEFACPLLRRWPLGTSYAAIAANVGTVAATLPRPVLVVDATGVGRGVMDILRAAKLPVRALVAVTITTGTAVSLHPGHEWHAPKRELVSAVQAALQGRRLKVARQLPEAATLTRELQTFSVKVTPAGNESYEALRERDHDDLVLALALPLWYATRGERPRTVPLDRTAPPPLPTP